MILVYEILDEMFNDGLLQLTLTDKIKPHVLSVPVVTQSEDNLIPGLFGIERRLAPSDAANKPVIRSKWDEDQRKNEVFVDVIERMNVLIATNGTITRCSVQGQVTMKSFLIGCPEMRMALNEDITVGQEERRKGYGSIIHLDKISFHPCVRTVSDNNILSIQPPDGEFTLINYNLQGDLPHGLPFRIYTYLEDRGSMRDIEVGVKLRCEIPSHCHAVNVTVNLPVPKTTTSISQRLSGTNQTAEFCVMEKKVVWKLRRISGKNEASAHFVLIDAKEHRHSMADLGPVALTFEISGFVTSGLQIRFIRVFDREHSYVPTRWIRYITTADSYVCKL
ncbi:hypothetical protein LSH36_31g08030 [Paralvinella palmiformis]|uniref:MHD domain-containing protein n=1 Tax=Paralvinella palmiformis TaxID=53620 RepID=A0AAD9K9V6_9ANNE|nr:hypothetical protein LSH36_31g08030 [Paralvinella palmiformis]